MRTPMTAEERMIRLQLDEATRRIRSALKRCPAIADLEYADIGEASDVVGEANRALHDALATTEALEQLQAASEEGVLLAATSRVALGVVREVLTVISAAIDEGSAAA